MPTLFRSPNSKIEEMPISTLAYIGDAVIELYFRLAYLKDVNTKTLAARVRKTVSKFGQAELLGRIWEDLTEEEMGVVKRGMNSKSAGRYGNDPLYRKSTGLETLVGFLFLKGRLDRLKELLERGMDL